MHDVLVLLSYLNYFRVVRNKYLVFYFETIMNGKYIFVNYAKF